MQDLRPDLDDDDLEEWRMRCKYEGSVMGCAGTDLVDQVRKARVERNAARATIAAALKACDESGCPHCNHVAVVLGAGA